MSGRADARAWANRLNLSTPLALGLALLGRATTSPWTDGLTVATGHRLPFPRVPAFTLGNVIFTTGTLEQLVAHDAQHPELMRHEARHASQYAFCLGPVMLPMYAGACLWSWLRTGDWWSRNVFETRAVLADGGYVQAPTRRLPGVKRRGGAASESGIR